MDSTGGGVTAGVVAQQYRYRFSDADFDEAANQLSVAGQPVALEPKPLQLLAELLRRVNEVVTKDELLDWVWDGRPTVENVLANAIAKLRKALGPLAAERILTVPRVGYRLLGPIERIAVGGVVAPDPELRPGMPVPHRESYELVRPLGAGGSARAWLARQPKLGHERVFKFASDADGLRALKREYTLARLLHAEMGNRPDLLPVQDANLAESPFFLEYEWGGIDLAGWAEQDGRLAALPREARLELFLDLARVVAAAHAIGVLHKDIKPSNILVAPKEGSQGWQVRLIDFGSAQALQPERLRNLGLTALGLTTTMSAGSDSLAATPLYLAPEVLAGQAFTVQADVYVLGLLLFQLLVGDLRRTLAPGWERDIGDELLCEDIAAATDGAPAARLASAADLIERVSTLEARRAALVDQRTQAANLAQVAATLAQAKARRPWLIAAMLFLSLGLVSSIGLLLRSSQATRKAEASARQAQALSDFAINDVLQSADISRIGEHRALLIENVMERAATAASTRFRDTPEVEGKLRLQLAELYLKLVKHDLASREFIAAEQAFDRAGGLDELKLDAMYGNVRALIGATKLAQAEDALKAAASAIQTLSIPDSNFGVKLARLRAEATVALASRDMEKAARKFGEALALAEALGIGNTLRVGLLRGQLDAYLRLGNLAAAKAVANILQGPEYAADRIGDILHARASVEVARLMNVTNEFSSAEILLSAAYKTLRQKLGENEMTLATVAEELARSYEGMGRDDECNQVTLEAHAIYLRTIGQNHEYTRIAGLNVALSYFEVGNPAEGLKQLELNRPWFIEHFGGENSPVVQAIDFHRSRALLDLRRPREASRLLARLSAAALNMAGNARYWPELLDAELARVEIQTGGGVVARRRLERAVAEMRKKGALDKETKRFVAELGLR